jgi:exodeoxyribonuclease VII large subunit
MGGKPALYTAMRFREDATLTVAGLNRMVRLGLEQRHGDVLVLGEISDLTRAASGHLYFTLNDETEAAQLRVVMFKGDARKSRALFENGARLCIRGGLTLYEPRGTYQLIARAAYPAGEGDLQAQFRKLLEKLSAEGLTASERKRPLPLLPRCIGLVTSEQGAAVHDVLRVASLRCPVRIVLSPCLVQGETAPESIVRALDRLKRLPELDVVIVARGGGSAEDLWAFNDERVARSIAAYPVPVVTGVGHEVDTTIADHVADLRAATPSNAAELVVPQKSELEERVAQRLRSMSRAFDTRLGRERLLLTRVEHKLRDPRPLILRRRAQIETLTQRLGRATNKSLARRQTRVDELARRLLPLAPRARLNAQRAALAKLDARLRLRVQSLLARRAEQVRKAHAAQENAVEAQLRAAQARLAECAARLNALSPLAVLGRGYAIAFRARDNHALRSAAEVAEGERIRIRLHEGEVRAIVGD